MYNLVTKELDYNVLPVISALADSYGEDSHTMNVILHILYAGMIAEENKRFAVLGKRIKRLGMHQILKENFTAQEAANFSRGRKAFVRVNNINSLDEECAARGF